MLGWGRWGPSSPSIQSAPRPAAPQTSTPPLTPTPRERPVFPILQVVIFYSIDTDKKQRCLARTFLAAGKPKLENCCEQPFPQLSPFRHPDVSVNHGLGSSDRQEEKGRQWTGGGGPLLGTHTAAAWAECGWPGACGWLWAQAWCPRSQLLPAGPGCPPSRVVTPTGPDLPLAPLF